MRKVLFLVSFGAIVFPAVILAVAASPPAPADRVAYLKTPDRNRALIYAAPDPVQPAAARAILDRAPWSPGQITAAYLYAPAAADLARGSLAADGPSILDALAAIETAAPAFLCRLTISPTGAKVWSGDCGEG